ncbi:hypothetical protein KGF56_003502 [Candida oxycetoniae]|uniref:Uncharacterized protein n=1 Tax=Candida oxycetoniae TaxID=497107 RepID=A0AAI9WX68_9ASCO|nr:uncharacterized protein KGF56_003502 [Candida oxycetoniae]KAI3403684.2 hypothetical protein KGF56_003502 [Candida oxycetoniae]
MIRGNWSLQEEIKQNERKRQLKIQQRQKLKFKLEKLQQCDPIKLYHKIENLEKRSNLSEKETSYLKLLKEDWAFIEKNKLHEGKIKSFLKDKDQHEKSIRKRESKLWGVKSVYFNPELNPLGKVPRIECLDCEVQIELKNWTVPLHSKRKKYDVDPLIKELNVKVPKGEPPKFYKLIQNTEKLRPLSSQKSKEQASNIYIESHKREGSSDSKEKEKEEEEEEDDEQLSATESLEMQLSKTPTKFYVAS